MTALLLFLVVAALGIGGIVVYGVSTTDPGCYPPTTTGAP